MANEYFIMKADGTYLPLETEVVAKTHMGAVGFTSYESALLAASAMVAANEPLPLRVCHLEHVVDRRYRIAVDVIIAEPGVVHFDI